MKLGSMKVVACLVAALLLMLAFAGCGGTPAPAGTAAAPASDAATAAAPEAPESEAPAPEDQVFTIETIHKISGIAWIEDTTYGNAAGCTQFAEESGSNCYVKTPPQADQALQNQLIEDAIAANVDAIAVVAIDSAACAPILKKAKEKGIVTVAHESADLGDAISYDLEAFTPQAYGEHMMEVLAKAMNYEGEYVCFVGALTSKSHNQYVDAAVAYQKANYPNMKEVTERIEDHEDMKQAHDKFLEVLKTYPNLKGALSCPMTSAGGIGLAIEEKGLIGKVSAVGTSIVSTAGQYLESGAVTAIMYWSPKDSAYAWNKIAWLILTGQEDKIKTGLDLGIPGYENCTVEGNVVYGNSWIDVTKENMADYPL